MTDTEPTSSAPIAPIRREIQVGVPVDTAFAFFTSHIGAWWPLAELSVHGKESLVAFEGDRLLERNGPQVAIWAEVVAWNPPTDLRLAWHPASGPEAATDLVVRFTPDGETTVVTVIQSGWERLADPAAAAEEYGHGWPEVLAEFRQLVIATTVSTGSSSDDAAEPLSMGEESFGPSVRDEADAGAAADVDDPDAGEADIQWFALLHNRGPALRDDESLFEHPMFLEHVAFLRRMLDRGLLVAAGPLIDEFGAGMAVVKVEPGRGQVDVLELATTDDLCVAGGYMTVSVRPWAVQFSA